MARTNNLTNFLTDVADAIKEKKGSQDTIAASDFDTEILNLPSGGGTYEQKTVNVIQNGTQTVIPSQGYDAMDEVTINTAVPLQTRSYSFTENTTTTLTPEQGYAGFSSVGIDINVSGGGHDAVKLFETEQTMQADPDAQDDDFAIVYRPSVQNYNTTNPLTACVFPNEVELPVTVSEDIYGSFSEYESYSFDGQVMLNATEFRFWGYTRTGQIEVVYTSSNGINYTKSSGPSSLSIDGEAWFEPYQGDTSLIGYFIKVAGHTFDGLYKYSTEIDNDYYTFGDLISGGTNGQPLWDKKYTVLKEPIHNLIMQILEPYNHYSISYLLVDEGNDLYSAYYSTSSTQNVASEAYIDWFNNKVYTRRSNISGYDHSYKISIDLNNNTSSRAEITSQNMTISGTTVEYLEEITGKRFASVLSSNTVFYYNTSSSSVSNFSLTYTSLEVSKYRRAETQFTLASAGDLLPGKVGYGKDGIVTGDNSVYDNLDKQMILNRYFGISAEEVAATNYSTKYPSLYDKVYDGFKFAYSRYPGNVGLQYMKCYHLEPKNNSPRKMWLGKLIKLPEMNAPSCKSAFISYDVYNKVYIIVAFTNYSNKGNLYISVYDENMQLIKSHTNVSNSNALYPKDVFYYNGDVYLVTRANSYKYLCKVTGSSLTTLYTGNLSTPRIAVDYITGECYIQEYYASASDYMVKVNLSTNAVTNVDIAIDVRYDAEFICYITSSAIKYKRMGESSFRSIAKPTSVTTKEWGIASNEDYLAILCNNYYVLVDLSDYSSTVMATGIDMGIYNDIPFPSLVGTNLYYMNRVSELFLFTGNGTSTRYHDKNMISSYMGGSPSRFEMLDDETFVYLKPEIQNVTSTNKATAVLLKFKLYDIIDDIDPDKFSFILPDNNTGLRLGGTVDLAEDEVEE